jgi:hypothetical protein
MLILFGGIYTIGFLGAPIGTNLSARHTAGANAAFGWPACSGETVDYGSGTHRHFRIGMTQDEVVRILNNWHRYTYRGRISVVVNGEPARSKLDGESSGTLYFGSASDLAAYGAPISSIKFSSVSSLLCFFTVVQTVLIIEEGELILISDRSVYSGP